MYLSYACREQLMKIREIQCAVTLLIGASTLLVGEDGYQIKTAHPRLILDDIKEITKRTTGPLADDYKILKQQADAAVKRGSVEFINNGWATPNDLMNCALAYLVEKEAGRENRKYIDLIIKQWGDGKIISNKQSSNFGYHALAYDWVYDALTPKQRVLYGDALGGWLRFYTDKPEIMLKYGHWEYNQTWGPYHLNIMNSRDSLTQKLFISAAILGAGTHYEADAKAFLDSWNKRVPSECIPAFNRMGGVWSESFGHGGYGPVTVIPYAFRGWYTSTGIDLLKQLKPWGYPVEEPRWVAYLMLPHNERTAWIDDNDGSRPGAFDRAAPMLRDSLSQWFSDRGASVDGVRERWQRVACYDPSIAAVSPATLPTAYLFSGAGHVYMRSAWNDPNAKWAFFGCGPQLAGHSHDDEGHFLIYKKGALVSRQGGQCNNDNDYYSGGSLIFNLVTIFDPNEKFRRDKNNENDGGLLRHVYETPPQQRGNIVAYETNKDYTYAAADVTKGYNSSKAREVTRQFLYLRGQPEFFVVFDRVEATNADFKRHFFLHVPTEPETHERQLTWLSLPEGDGDKNVLSQGRSRTFMHTLLPRNAEVVLRGGPGKEAWGHPLEKTAQYNHESPGRKKGPVCPWRIEIGDAGAGARTLFLHVFEISDEGVKQATDLKLAAPAGVDIGQRWQVRFNADGALGGTVNGKPLTTKVDNEAQYR